MKALIVDDERRIRSAIRSMIKYSVPVIKEVKEATGVQNALEILDVYRPDLVFLDVRLGDGTGFDVLRNKRTLSGKVIFITAYDQYAIEAFEHNAVDYLLKPVSEKDLLRGVKRIRERNQFSRDKAVTNQQLGFVDEMPSEHLVIRSSNAVHVIRKADIVRCEADINYTVLHLVNKKKITVSKTLKLFEQQLVEDGFIRVHRAHLVNIKMIKTYYRSVQGKLVLYDGNEIPVSLRRRESVLKLLSNF